MIKKDGGGILLAINFIADPHFSPHVPSSRKDNYPESILNKYLSVNRLFRSDYNIICGDVFHKPTLPLRYVNHVAAYERQSQALDGHRTYVIPGNHDVNFADTDYLMQSSLGNWLATGLVDRLDLLSIEIPESGRYLHITGWDFKHPDPPSVPPHRRGDLNILVGHAFWEPSSPPGRDIHLPRSFVPELHYNAIVLGHDHAKYKPVTEHGTVIYRPGSLSRGTSHFSNVWREVSILRLEVTEDSYSFYYADIPSLPPEQAFSALSRSEDRNKYKQDMSKLVKSMLESNVQSGDVYAVLNSMDIPKSDRDYVESLLLSYGLARISA